ncbi:hypothetical protein BDZ89DRAFT_1079794 [Hymenopellis radicata]|nr:hypothetical protein BDZ89DRAFT_1079794 [Hymenopellis radicata]
MTNTAAELGTIDGVLAKKLRALKTYPWQQPSSEVTQTWNNNALASPPGWSCNWTHSRLLTLIGRYALSAPITPILFSLDDPAVLIVKAGDNNYYRYHEEEVRYLGMWESTELFLEEEDWSERGVVKGVKGEEGMKEVWEEQNMMRWVSQGIVNEREGR